MLLLYNTGVQLYFVAIYIASFFNKKAKLWVNGRKEQAFIRFSGCIWFHFASLGEFEQGRPVLEGIRELYPDEKIVITFFSPSGYEVRKNTPLADAVYYLPLDTAANARYFIDFFQPKMAVFTKYEYWYHFFNETNNRNIPLYVISGIFRPNQVFFKWYGGLHRKMLGFVRRFFVQDEGSLELLHQIGVTNVTVSGDTRFDRVWVNSLQPKAIAGIAEFKNDQKIFIAGSTWPADEQLIATLTTQYPGWKFIIAPHEISEEKIAKLISILPSDTTLRYSQISNLTPDISYLIIDNVGMLSSLYQYADIAYIGGGFGAGIHNTLEAGAFGLPVIFGPEYSKFKEAKDLIALQAGFSVADEAALKTITGKLINDHVFYNKASLAVTTYVKEHTGATAAIINFIKN
ncbi:3-deoxy-D-manno-octulosonic acid transferase [Mucilaginibacter sp. BJC16-A38]|uniref:3-deoxy-D-manno-octulosonic acid transferase n=1 Tax=Mucilaginibacter phenanthrenivorans TaxID=1234842 RepID=UPI002156F94B|nr:glycosyltransferase N-terminal domain-containing protein [Mucilaginibacter phenanthrenivorans]MCR8559156.1 3-deoxy-D-manno-octulosonic acid transferase [Mucilaginibacter phenanthrenivorans]